MLNTDMAARPVSRRFARELTPAELAEVGGGDNCTVCIATCDPVSDASGETSDALHYYCQTAPDHWA